MYCDFVWMIYHAWIVCEHILSAKLYCHSMFGGQWEIVVLVFAFNLVVMEYDVVYCCVYQPNLMNISQNFSVSTTHHAVEHRNYRHELLNLAWYWLLDLELDISPSTFSWSFTQWVIFLTWTKLYGVKFSPFGVILMLQH